MADKKLTDNQIVMLMERCYKKEESVVITQFNSDDTKTEITVDDILRVIYRQNAEIKTLQERNVILRGAFDAQKAEIAKYNAELEEVNQRADEWHKEAELNAAEIIKLQTEKAKFDNTILYDLEQVNKIVETAKVEATKEFAEDFEEEFFVGGVTYSITKEEFDEFIKRKVGEN